MTIRGIGVAAAAVVVAILLGACSLTSLFLPPGDLGFSSFDPLSSAGAPATFRHGTATITITSGEPRVVELTHLSADQPSMVMPGFGTFVSWRTGDWLLEIDSVVPGLLGSGQPMLTITREDTDPPLTADGSTCMVTYTATSASHIAGRAQCKGLAWVDSFEGNPMDLPVPSGSLATDHPLFDVTIVFDATP